MRLKNDNKWVRGQAREIFTPPTIAQVRREFLETNSLSPRAQKRVDRLVAEFVTRTPNPDPRAIAFRETYGDRFSRAGVERVTAAELKTFANSDRVAHPGNMSVFNDAWNKLGEQDARTRLVETISYLLYGPKTTPLEDRLTDLIDGNRGLGFTGFKESLLTKVLCMVEPERFLPILKYTGKAGKAEIAEAVFGLKLPKPERSRLTIGRLVVWSNDRLVSFSPQR